jgi:NDP-sugar pyrophosphorylase family protein
MCPDQRAERTLRESTNTTDDNGEKPLKAVVLAGGLGTRLRPLTYSRPKPMLPLGPKPALQYVIESLARSGFNRIIVTTNYLQEQIEGYFGNGSRFGVSLTYPEEKAPLGTAGSVKNAEKYLDETFALVQGDNITDINMSEQLRYHRRKNALATLGVIRAEQPWNYGVVVLDQQNKIMGFQEKPHPEQCRSNLINTGLYILEPDVLDLIPSGRPFDFAKDVFPIILDQGKDLYGYKARGFWTDIGSVDGFLKASYWILSKMTNNISPSADTGHTKITGSVQIGDRTTLEEAVVRGPVYLEDLCVIDRNVFLGPGTTLKRSVSVGGGSKINGALVFDSTRIGSGVILNRCIVDTNCEIGSDSVIETSAILGAGCRIGEGATVCHGVKLEPGIAIERGKTIKT